MIKRIFENLKWLFNHPPIGIEADKGEPVCKYCGSNYNTWRWPDFCFCSKCLEKALDKSLKKGGGKDGRKR